MASQKKSKKDVVDKLRDEVKQDAGDEVDSVQEGEIVSKKKVIYIEIDDEIGAVYDKIKALSGRHVYVVVPQKAVIFQSIVNLKILKRKAKEHSKTIYLITNDKNGIYLASQLGIVVYDKVDRTGKPSLFSTEVNDEKLRITPLRAAVNAVDEETPTRLSEKKLSISEILRKQRTKKMMDISRLKPSQKLDQKKKKMTKFVLVSPNRHALVGLVVFSVFILLAIIYIALPGVTISLTPAASVLEKSVNITLADSVKNRVELDTKPTHMIASYPISTTVQKTITHFATGKKLSDKSANASGKLTIVNTTANTWPLITQTRFQTNDGIVFRIPSPVNVPAANASGPGKVEVYVVADPMDANGTLTGDRGNIPPSRFFLPGLRSINQSKIYAESYANMAGGVTDYIAFVSKEDVGAAKLRIKDELMKNSSVDLQKVVDEKTKSAQNNITYSLLTGDGAIQISEPKIELPPNLEGQEIKQFTVTGEISVSGVYFNRAEMLDILKSELLLKKSPQKELLRINENSTTYQIFEKDEGDGKIKLTANIKGIEQYDINPDTENGQRLLQKIKDHVVGKEVEDAKLYIQNLPEVNKVEIKSWPAWAPNIPNIPDNIDFKITPVIFN